MIIKEFVFEKCDNPRSVNHLKDYYYKILNKNIRELYDLTKNFSGCVVCLGKDSFTILKDAYFLCVPGYDSILSSIDFTNFISLDPKVKNKNNNLYKIGYLIQREVYYDSRLKSNLIIIDSDIKKIEYYISVKNRKEKIKKLNEK